MRNNTGSVQSAEPQQRSVPPVVLVTEFMMFKANAESGEWEDVTYVGLEPSAEYLFFRLPGDADMGSGSWHALAATLSGVVAAAGSAASMFDVVVLWCKEGGRECTVYAASVQPFRLSSPHHPHVAVGLQLQLPLPSTTPSATATNVHLLRDPHHARSVLVTYGESHVRVALTPSDPAVPLCEEPECAEFAAWFGCDRALCRYHEHAAEARSVCLVEGCPSSVGVPLRRVRRVVCSVCRTVSDALKGGPLPTMHVATSYPVGENRRVDYRCRRSRGIAF